MDRSRSRIFLLALVVSFTIALATQAAATEVSGTLLAGDGRRPAFARIDVEAPEWKRPLATIEPSPDGSFRVSVRRGEMTLLRFQGGNLRDVVVPLPPGIERLRLEVVPGEEPWPDDAEKVSVVSALNGFDLWGGRLMKAEPDGTFTVTIADAPSDRFAYAICEEGSRRLFPGTVADEWETDPSGRPRAVLAARDGKVTVRFDPRLLPHRGSAPCVRVLEGPAAIERFVDLYEWMRRERRRVGSLAETVRSGSTTWDEVFASLDRDGEARTAMVAAEKDPEVRAFATVTALAAWEYQPRATALARIAVGEVGPASPYWGLFPQALMSAMARTEANVDSIRRFIERVAGESPDRRVRSEALSALLRFYSEGDPVRYGAVRRKLLRELPETAAAEQARQTWPARLEIGRGRPFPSVRFPSAEKGRPDIDLRDHRGRWVLLDVWAVWCGPCTAEVPELTKVWRRYRDRLDVVSVSLDPKREIVEGFRENRARMPWLHGILVKGFEDPILKRLAIRAVPSLFLIAPDGTLRATSLDLRGKDMVGSVGRYLAGKGARAETATAKTPGAATAGRP